MAGFWDSVLPGGLGAYGYSELMGDLDKQRDKVSDTISGLSAQAQQGTSFKPFGVTSNIGTATAGPNGDVGFRLSDPQAALGHQLRTGAEGMFSAVTGDRGAREQEVYDRIRATQTPEEARQRLQMQQGLFNTGRMGMSTMEGGGGSPEQLAFETARAEAMNRASLAAMGQANAEQLQDFNIGQGMMSSSYQPLRELQNTMGYGLNTSQLAQQGQLTGANLMAQLGLGGLTADTNFSNIKGNAFGNMVQAALPIVTGVGKSIDDAGSLWEWIKGVGERI